MALAWQMVDILDDSDDARFPGDPAELVDAYAELVQLAQRPAWHAQAACRGQGPEPWFPSRGESTADARAVCAACPVRAECLTAGMRTHHGIWGGTSERQRRHLRRAAA